MHAAGEVIEKVEDRAKFEGFRGCPNAHGAVAGLLSPAGWRRPEMSDRGRRLLVMCAVLLSGRLLPRGSIRPDGPGAGTTSAMLIPPIAHRRR